MMKSNLKKRKSMINYLLRLRIQNKWKFYIMTYFIETKKYLKNLRILNVIQPTIYHNYIQNYNNS